MFNFLAALPKNMRDNLISALMSDAHMLPERDLLLLHNIFHIPKIPHHRYAFI